ncbi:MAG TPA: FKBP-type peptidyl-prolyl cis-trans isomerase [Longimicrobiales bacterium]
MNRSRNRSPLVGLALALGLAACSDEPTAPEPVSVEETVFAPELGIDLSQMTELETGVYIQDIIPGDSTEAFAGDSVTVHYKLWLHDGTLIHDTHAGVEDEPAVVWLVTGPHGVIDGWVDGVPGMRIGGTRKLVIPWERGYGSFPVHDEFGNVIIPAYSNLVFEVELMDTRTPESEPET